MSSAKLRPGFIEFEDVRAAIASHLGDAVDSRKLAERLLAEPALTLWRAPVDNDGFKLMPERMICVTKKSSLPRQGEG